MEPSKFDAQAEALLAKLFAAIDADLGDVLDVDFNHGILEIELPDDAGVYVLNKHGPSSEVWLSSPRSGAWHFRLSPDRKWRSTRGGDIAPELVELLSGELSQATGRSVALDA
jgi:frataxin